MVVLPQSHMCPFLEVFITQQLFSCHSIVSFSLFALNAGHSCDVINNDSQWLPFKTAISVSG